MSLYDRRFESRYNKEFQIVGAERVWKQLELMYNLGARTHNFRAAFARAAKPMKKAARDNARSFARKMDRISKTRLTKRGKTAKSKRTSGPIWKSISILTSKRYKGVFWLGPTRGRTARFDAWYAYFQEAGTVRGIRGKFFMKNAYVQYEGITRYLIVKELYREIYKIAAKRMAA